MTTDISPISEREREILRLVATGATNQQIALALNISVNTVKVHLRNIFGKIGATSRTEATVFAMRTGLVEGMTPSEADTPAEEVDEAFSQEQSRLSTPIVTTPIANFAEARTNVSPVIVATPARRLRPVALITALAAVLALFAAGFLASRLISGSAVPTVLPGAATQPGNDTWHTLAAMPQGRAAFGLTSYESDGRQFLYALAGQVANQPSGTALRYDIQNNTWDALSAKPTAVSDVRAAAIGKLIYVPGGKLASGQPSDVFEAYDQQADRWVTLAQLPAARSGYALAAFEGKLYLFGGWGGNTVHNDVFSYDPDSNQWATLKPMPTARAYADAVTFGQEIFVLGGEDARGPVAVNERFTPANESSGNPWATRLPMPQAASRVAATTTAAGDRQIYVFGNASAERSHVVYNIAKDSWRTVPLPESIGSDARVAAVDNQLYLIGGQSGTAGSANVYAYKPVFVVLLPAINN